MGAERFEMARKGVEGREGMRAGVIYPFRWRALSDLTSALPGRPKFRIFESRADLF
jgi:hypothetical protein